MVVSGLSAKVEWMADEQVSGGSAGEREVSGVREIKSE